MSKTRLIDTYDATTGGIFSALDSLDVPWKNDVDGATLDTEYYFNISGQKSLSPLMSHYAPITQEKLTTVANLVFNMFRGNWEKLYYTLSLEYNPISNYDMTETETIDNDRSNTRTNTGTQTTAGSNSATGSTSSNSENDVYGFNSVTPVNDTESDVTASNTTSSTDSHTTTDNLTETETGGENIERTLTRSGNIGVTTSQQMIQSERDLWLWNFFYNVVFPNVDKVLTLEIYQR